MYIYTCINVHICIDLYMYLFVIMYNKDESSVDFSESIWLGVFGRCKMCGPSFWAAESLATMHSCVTREFSFVALRLNYLPWVFTYCHEFSIVDMHALLPRDSDSLCTYNRHDKCSLDMFTSIHVVSWPCSAYILQEWQSTPAHKNTRRRRQRQR